MTLNEYNTICNTLAHSFQVVQWGDAKVWKVGTQGKNKNKVYAIAGWQDEDQQLAITFKTSDIGYEILRDTPGCRPAPYLASRGMKWIQRTSDEGLADTDLKDYIIRSHQLAAANLTKKLQKELGFLKANCA